MTISLGRRLPDASSNLPGSRTEPGRLVPGITDRLTGRFLRTAPLFGLAPGGVYRARLVTQPAGELLPHRFTLTPGRNRWRFIFCGTVPTQTEVRAVGVTHHHAPWSPDFPPEHVPRDPLPDPKAPERSSCSPDLRGRS